MKDVLQKVENVSLFLWLLLIPTQLGKHFWPEWSQVMGVRSDYLAPILYFSDIIWIIWILSEIFNLKFKIFNQKEKIFSFENLLVGIFVVLNMVVAGNKWVAVYRWLRIGQWTITYKMIKNYFHQKGGHTGPPLQQYLIWIIPCWIGIESLLGLSQIVKGGSLQGIWYWLGERRFTLTTIGVAQMSVFGEGLIRAYGTFSHPNSMAGFLLVGWLLWEKITNKKKLVYWMTTWLAVVGIIISGSRTVWLLAVLLPIITNYKLRITNYRKSVGYGVIMVGVFLLILGVVGINYRTSDFVGGWDNDSLVKRISLNVAAIKMWRDNYMLGVGAGNFVAKLPEYQTESKFFWLQPVHNIFLLAGTELGMLGVIVVIKFLISNFQYLIKKKNYLILGVVVVTGLVDHYWLTLPQNINLLAVVFGII